MNEVKISNSELISQQEYEFFYNLHKEKNKGLKENINKENFSELGPKL